MRNPSYYLLQRRGLTPAGRVKAMIVLAETSAGARVKAAMTDGDNLWGEETTATCDKLDPEVERLYSIWEGAPC